MEPKKSDDRPESPKKKIRPSSTTNSEVSHSDSQSATDSVGTSSVNSEVNGYGLAPTRRDRSVEACSSSEVSNPDCPSRRLPTPPKEVASIQEEVVSSSENSVNRTPPVCNDGNADSLSNEAEVMGRVTDSEADRKEL